MSVRIGGKKIASNDSELPAQNGNAGKFLSTDGGQTLWKTISASDAHSLPDSTKYGATIVVSLNTTDYKITTTLKDQDGNTLGIPQVVDLPIESVVVNGVYDSVNKKIVLTLQNGTTIDIPVGDLISGLQTEITVSNKLSADLVTDSTTTNKFVTAGEKSTWNSKQDAISDLDSIRSKANSAIQPSDLATVATSGEYSDLRNTPTIPTTLAQLTGDVSISNPATGHHLVYNGDTGKWENTPSSASISWGGITGTLSDQTDLKNALDAKADSSSLATVATSGSYTDLSNKPTLATVATSGSYNDLSNKPTLGTAAAADTTDFATAAQGSKADTAVQPGDLATVATSGDYDDLTDKYVITYDSENTRLVIAK